MNTKVPTVLKMDPQAKEQLVSLAREDKRGLAKEVEYLVESEVKRRSLRDETWIDT